MKKELRLTVLLLVILLTACQNKNSSPKILTQAPQSSGQPMPDGRVIDTVIYGDDNRLDLYQISDPTLLNLAHSTVALIQASNLTSQANGQTLIHGESYQTSNNLCATERFIEQTAAAFCSGSLIAPDLVITAGHCITNQTDCSNVRFVFGYSLNQVGFLPTQVATSEVYRCANIIHTQMPAQGADFSVIKLDRQVTGHTPLQIRTSGEIGVGESVFVVGHPSGLPVKVAGGATVRDSSNPGFFVANLDTYGGNSGSAVFNNSSGIIEGILVRGDQDFIPKGSCLISNVCPLGGCRGEDVTKISNILPFILTTPLPTPQPSATPAGRIETFTANPNLAIPDNNSSGISSQINIASVPQGRKVQIAVNITHTFIGDLVVTLIPPAGASVILSSRVGASQHDIRGTFGKDLFTSGNLASLSNIKNPGLWKLTVTDRAARDVGTLVSWGITFTP